MSIEQFSGLASGLAVAFSIEGLLYCMAGVTLGMFAGVLPGVGAMASISMLLPITLYLDPSMALIMLGGIYYGATYGGSTASILLNLPGTPNSAVTCLDGYPMAQQGRAGVALFTTTIVSFVGGMIGLLIMAFFSPPLANLAIRFSSQEYFSLMLLGLLATALLAGASPWKSLCMVVFGLLLGTVGIDVSSGITRLTFGVPELFNGLPVVALALGLFGLPEVIGKAGRPVTAAISRDEISFRSMLPTRDDWRRMVMPTARGTGIGAFLGALPGTGATIAAFMSYAVEKRVSREPDRFGKGAIEGISGPEAANNAAVQTAFIPTLTLGIPGDAVMALMLAVLMIHGVEPGPRIISERPDMFWGIIASFFLGNIILLILNIPLIGLWVRVLLIPYRYLSPQSSPSSASASTASATRSQTS